MATFTYVAKDRLGNEISGKQPGENLGEVIKILHAQELAVLRVVEEKPGSGRISFKEWWIKNNTKKASARELAIFSRQLATVLESGIPLVKGLKGLAADSSAKSLSRSVADIGTRLEKGEALSDALAAHPQNFNEMYMSMVRAGERAGTLDRIIEELAIYLEKVDNIRTKVRGAMMYPMFIMGFALLASLFLIIKIVPTFAKSYADMGQELPMMTRVVIGISDAILNNAVVTVLLVCVVSFVFWALARTDRGKYFIDAATLKLPVFGPIISKTIMSRFTRTFGILQGSGLPLLESLELVGGAAGNRVVSRALDEVRDKVTAGHGITDSFRATGKFPEMVLQMMSTGEESGELDSMMLKVSDFYDRQVEATVHGISALIEPILIVSVGLIIGFIVMSVFLPMFSMGEALMQGGAAL